MTSRLAVNAGRFLVSSDYFFAGFQDKEARAKDSCGSDHRFDHTHSRFFFKLLLDLLAESGFKLFSDFFLDLIFDLAERGFYLFVQLCVLADLINDFFFVFNNNSPRTVFAAFAFTKILYHIKSALSIMFFRIQENQKAVFCAQPFFFVLHLCRNSGLFVKNTQKSLKESLKIIDIICYVKYNNRCFSA